MMHFLYRSRPGATLIELLIYLVIMSVIAGITIPLMFLAAENRVLQQTVAVVEQNGTQLLQHIGLTVRNAEAIVSPAIGQTSKVLVLQTGSGTTNPTIIGVQSGSLVIVEADLAETISTEQVAIYDFRVRNTSTSSAHQSIAVSFRVSRTIRLQQPHSYAQEFEAAIGLLPDEEQTGSCNCPAPACVNGTSFEWYLCRVGACDYATIALECS